MFSLKLLNFSYRLFQSDGFQPLWYIEFLVRIFVNKANNNLDSSTDVDNINKELIVINVNISHTYNSFIYISENNSK